MGICIAKTVCLYKIKDYLFQFRAGKSENADSNYKFLTRLFNQKNTPEMTDAIYKTQYDIAMELLDGKQAYYIIDGTKWNNGKYVIHLLVLSIIVGNNAIPVAAHQIETKGHSDFHLRKFLLEEFIKRNNAKGGIIIGDREYIGYQWFNYLESIKWDFVFRIKEENYFQKLTGKYSNSKDYIKAMMKKNRKHPIGCTVEIETKSYTRVYVKKQKLKKEEKEPIIHLISSLPPEEAEKISQIYKKRWKIETQFKHEKTNGLNIEDANLRDTFKLEFLIALAGMAFTLITLRGQKEKQEAETKRKNQKKDAKNAKLNSKKDNEKDGEKKIQGEYFERISCFRYGISYVLKKIDEIKSKSLCIANFINYMINDPVFPDVQ